MGRSMLLALILQVAAAQPRAPCTPGTYVEERNSILFCFACPGGSYCPGGYSSAIISCSSGTFSTGYQGSCTPCPLNFYQYNAGQSGCLQCPIGTTTAATGSFSFAACCPAGSYGQDGMTFCLLCPPGTYSLAGASVCTPCPAGTYGSSAGLVSSTCTGTCTSTTACPLGTAYPPPAMLTKDASCVSSGRRAVPPVLGVLLWPAASPTNPLHVDLVIAPLETCRHLVSSEACAAAASITGPDGIVRFVVGTADALHIEAAEAFTCSV